MSETTHNHRESQQQGSFQGDELDSLRDPFASNLDKYMHSSHIKSIESNSSDEYDLQGTATKHKRNHPTDLPFSKTTGVARAQQSNMFNRDAEVASNEVFSLKRSLPSGSQNFKQNVLGRKKLSEHSGNRSEYSDKENYIPKGRFKD